MSPADLRSVPTEAFLKPGPYKRTDIAGKPMSLLQEMSQAVGQMVLDGYVFTEESIDLLEPGNLEGIQIMMGGTEDEATTLIGDFLHAMDITPDTVEEKMERQLGRGWTKYYNIKTQKDAERSLMRAISDQHFQKYLLTAQITESNKNHQTYVYRFGQIPPGRNSEFRGAYHSSDLWYMFNSMREKKNQRRWTAEDYRMAEIMSGYWINFVKYSDPNGEDGNGWKPCRAENDFEFLELKAGKSAMTSNAGWCFGKICGKEI